MRTLMSRVRVAALVGACFLTGAAACEGPRDSQLGRMHAQLTLADVSHDVIGMDYKIVAAGAECAAPAIAAATVGRQGGALPTSLQPSGGAANHVFFDAFFNLPPGVYQVCATPTASEGPSAFCGVAQGNATVVAELTTEILLVSQCRGQANGGLDVITTLNDPPRIDGLSFRPGKFVSQCDKAGITVTASDPNGDALSYAWSVVNGPGGGLITSSGNTATFTPGAAGDYELKVVVTDVHGGTTSLTFPLHVAPGQCKVAVVAGAGQFYEQFFAVFVPDVVAGLTGQGLTVDFIDAGDSQPTPTLAQLLGYSALLVFSDAGGFQDPVAFGNVAADYVDAGGKVVVAVFANASIPIAGRFVSGGYLLLDPSGQNQLTSALGAILEPGSPLMTGVASLDAQVAYQSAGGPINGGVVVAEWANGAPLVVRGVKNGRNRVDLNLYPPSSAARGDFWSGDGFRLMANALRF